MPIRRVILSDGTVRLAVPITVEGARMDAMLDTGSRGLRVLQSALPVRGTGDMQRFPFASGVVLEGPTLPARVSVGGRAGVLQIQQVGTVRCMAQRPGCPASRLAPSAYRIGGDGLPGEGFLAILGIGAAGAEGRANPLTALGVRAFSVGPGRLSLFDTPPTRVRMALPTDATGWMQGCLVNGANGRRHCGALSVDSGQSAIILAAPDVPPGASWARNTPGSLEFGARGTTLTLAFAAGEAHAPESVHLRAAATATVRILAGSLIFDRHTVLFDAEGRPYGVMD